jgi:hypothetical protein
VIGNDSIHTLTIFFYNNRDGKYFSSKVCKIRLVYDALCEKGDVDVHCARREMWMCIVREGRFAHENITGFDGKEPKASSQGK